MHLPVERVWIHESQAKLGFMWNKIRPSVDGNSRLRLAFHLRPPPTPEIERQHNQSLDAALLPPSSTAVMYSACDLIQKRPRPAETRPLPPGRTPAHTG